MQPIPTVSYGHVGNVVDEPWAYSPIGHIILGETKEEAIETIQYSGYPYVFSASPFFVGSCATKWVPIDLRDEESAWCKELDGSFTYRSLDECMGGLQPGYWANAKEAGKMPYFVRQQKKKG